MYYVDAFKSDVIIDMNTGMEVRDSSIKSDGKRYRWFDEMMVSSSGHIKKENAIAEIKKLESKGYRVEMEECL